MSKHRAETSGPAENELAMFLLFIALGSIVIVVFALIGLAR